MARKKEFDRDLALAAAINVFREHGFEGTSTEMLVSSMKIGRQSLYDTFGDKWSLYRLSIERYATEETDAHISVLQAPQRALDGIAAVIDRVIQAADQPCLGVNSICEFGQSRADLNKARDAAGLRLAKALTDRIQEAQTAGDIAATLSSDAARDFLLTSIAGIRLAARSGARGETLKSIGELTLRALS